MTMAPAGSPEGLRPPGGRPRDDDRPTRKPLPIWDRIKFLVLLVLIWFILAWSAMASNPLVGFTDAVRIEARAGVWVFVLIGLEALRQIHFLISEHWAGYHRFWTVKFFGGLERTTHRRLSDWTRFRLGRLVAWVFWIAVIAVVVGKVTHTNPVLALLSHAALHLACAAVRAPAHVHRRLHRDPVRRDLLVPVPGWRGRVLPGRHQDPVHRRLGPGPRAGAGQGEHPLPGGPGADRVPGRVRARRHPALGAARHRQDADGRGGGGRDRPAVRVRGPGRVHQHVHGRRHPEGQVAVPQAAPAGAALRRRDRVLRRGRLAGQPRRAGPGRRPAGARPRPPRPPGRRAAATASPTCRRTCSGGWPSGR